MEQYISRYCSWCNQVRKKLCSSIIIRPNLQLLSFHCVHRVAGFSLICFSLGLGGLMLSPY